MTSTSNPALLADLIVALHLATVLFVVGGELLILVGPLFRWQFVRNRWFRLSHLAVILFIAVQAALKEPCPLTIWEFELRQEAGQEGREGTFLGRLFHDILFVDLSFATLTWIYIGFGVLVVVSLFLVPPRWRAAAKH